MRKPQNETRRARPTNVHIDDNVIDFAARATHRKDMFAPAGEHGVNIDSGVETSSTTATRSGRSRWGGVSVLSYDLPELWEVSINGWLLWLQLGGLAAATLRVRRG